MRNFKALLFVMFITIICLSLFVACIGENGSSELTAPTNLKVDDKGVLSWDKVSEAIAYIVDIDGEEKPQVETNSYTCLLCKIKIIIKPSLYSLSERLNYTISTNKHLFCRKV